MIFNCTFSKISFKHNLIPLPYIKENMLLLNGTIQLFCVIFCEYKICIFQAAGVIKKQPLINSDILYFEYNFYLRSKPMLNYKLKVTWVYEPTK